MNDFLTRLASKALGREPLVEPRLAPRFAALTTTAKDSDEAWWERLAEAESCERKRAEP